MHTRTHQASLHTPVCVRLLVDVGNYNGITLERHRKPGARLAARVRLGRLGLLHLLLFGGLVLLPLFGARLVARPLPRELLRRELLLDIVQLLLERLFARLEALAGLASLGLGAAPPHHTRFPAMPRAATRFRGLSPPW